MILKYVIINNMNFSKQIPNAKHKKENLGRKIHQREMNTFLDNQCLREFITIRSAL